VGRHLNSYEYGQIVAGIALPSIEVGSGRQHFVPVDVLTIDETITESELEIDVMMPQQFY
jgi:hypothetical protein